MIRLLLVDDHDIVRTGIAHIIEKQNGIEIVGETGTGEEALRLARKLKPDVVLMDVNMPGLGGLEATRRIHLSMPETKVIILTVHSEAPFPTHLLDAGASGYLTKGCAASELVDSIRAVNRNQRYIGKDIAQRLALSLLPGADKSPFDDLSSREMEVMMMLIQGLEVSQIAETLSLSPKTVSTYKYRIYDKLDVKNDVELTHLAIRHGIIEAVGMS
jgi:two-component system invasion response regulator UvrY